MDDKGFYTPKEIAYFMLLDRKLSISLQNYYDGGRSTKKLKEDLEEYRALVPENIREGVNDLEKRIEKIVNEPLREKTT